MSRVGDYFLVSHLIATQLFNNTHNVMFVIYISFLPEL